MDLLLRNACVLDVADGSVTVRDVGVANGLVAEPGGLSDPEEIDAGELTVMFGLWDNHCHPGSLMYDPNATGYFEPVADRTVRAAANLTRATAMGITGIRATGEGSGIDLAWARAEKSGDAGIPLPRLFCAGTPVGTTGGHGTAWPRDYVHVENRLIADGPVELTRAVRTLGERGADWVKILLTGGLFSEHEAVDGGQMSEDELNAVMTAARERGLPVAAHCGSARWAERFAAVGGRSIEHGYALDEKAAGAMAAAGMWLIPTLGVTHDEDFMAETHWPEHAVRRARETAAIHEESLRVCLAAGVHIATGADLNPSGPRLHAELGFLEKAGMERLAVLAAATTSSRRLNGLGSSTTPSPGDAADLILLRDSPLISLDVLREPVGVIVRGRLVCGAERLLAGH